MSHKHRTNQQKKQQRLRQVGAVCSNCGATHQTTCCGEIVPPSDPRWIVAVNKRLVTNPPLKATAFSPPRPRPKLDIPAWVENLRKHLADSQLISPEQLVYKGQSNKAIPKVGKNRKPSYMFIIEPPLPMKHEGETKFLWHGTRLENAYGILTQGLIASVGGMLGPGVYLGELGKARNYAVGEWSVLFYIEATLGKISIAPPGGDDSGADTLQCTRGLYTSAWNGRIRRKEWCVKDPSRITIREIHIVMDRK